MIPTNTTDTKAKVRDRKTDERREEGVWSRPWWPNTPLKRPYATIDASRRPFLDVNPGLSDYGGRKGALRLLQTCATQAISNFTGEQYFSRRRYLTPYMQHSFYGYIGHWCRRCLLIKFRAHPVRLKLCSTAHIETEKQRGPRGTSHHSVLHICTCHRNLQSLRRKSCSPETTESCSRL